MKLAGLLLALSAVLLRGGTKVPPAIAHINAAAAVFDEVNSDPDRGIPRDLLDKARCIGIVPSLKHAGVILEAHYGNGVVVCRNNDIPSGWAGPAFVRIESGSVGFQYGLGETDLIFLIMDQSRVGALMEDKFDLSGADDGAMAGPIGRSAPPAADPVMHSAVLAWARAHGKFQGASLAGLTLRAATQLNAKYYGGDPTPEQILTGAVRPPHTTGVLTSTLDEYIPSARQAHGKRR